MKKIVLIIALISFFAMEVFSQQKTKKYNLFNAVPKKEMRDLSTDRPDATESANTLDAGHFQIESDLFKTIRNRKDGILSIENNYNVANLKLGLTNSVDFHLIVNTYVNTFQKDETGNKTNNKSGFGNMTIRVRKNLWGNDDGKTALAIMPYVSLPTGKMYDDNAVEGGVVFPFNLTITDVFSFGTQAQFDWTKSQNRAGYHASISQSAVLGMAFTKRTEMFVESYYNYDFEKKKIDVSFNTGPSYELTENLKIDAGVNLGLTKNTDKVYFIGFSFRY